MVLSRFAISKLTAWDISAQAFIEMAKPVGINPTFFLILLIVISYLTTAFLSIHKRSSLPSLRHDKFVRMGVISNTLGVLTMIGALLSEFYLRLQPKWGLVYIAIGVIAFSVVNLSLIRKSFIKII